MATEPQFIVVDAEVGDDEVEAVCATLGDVTTSTAHLSPRMAGFLEELRGAKGVSEASAMEGPAVIVFAVLENIARMAGYALDYRPPGSTVLDPISYAVIRHWTEAEAAWRAPEPAPQVTKALSASHSMMKKQLGSALMEVDPAFTRSRETKGGYERTTEWRRVVEGTVTVVALSTGLQVDRRNPAPDHTISGVVGSWSGFAEINAELGPDDAMTPQSCTHSDVLIWAGDAAEWLFTIASPTPGPLVTMAIKDLSSWLRS